ELVCEAGQEDCVVHSASVQHRWAAQRPMLCPGPQHLAMLT
uniref:Uncharacterized protein n=1 Tax=Myotis lucifugus TaxID=59463 RepID=G1Q0K0_MYOLU